MFVDHKCRAWEDVSHSNSKGRHGKAGGHDLTSHLRTSALALSMQMGFVWGLLLVLV